MTMMTRDEAIEILAKAQDKPCTSVREKWIDTFVALGMLKLEEPKGVWVRAKDVIAGRIESVGGSYPGYEAEKILELLAAAGLKVVEK